MIHSQAEKISYQNLNKHETKERKKDSYVFDLCILYAQFILSQQKHLNQSRLYWFAYKTHHQSDSRS